MTRPDKHTTRPVIFGEVLYDCFPDGTRVPGGAPFNVAWHLQAFGMQPVIVSAVGNDDDGDALLERMERWGMDTKGVQVLPDQNTGTVQVSFRNGEPAYDIVQPSAWDKMDTGCLPDITAGSILYHGSLALRLPGNRDVLEALRLLLQSPVFVDINLRPPYWNEEIRNACLFNPETLKLNRDEFEFLSGRPVDIIDTDSLEELAASMGIRRFIITLGSEGVCAWEEGEQQLTRLPVIKHGNIVDTVGAGDAFSSVCLLGLGLQWPLRTLLERAMAFAATVVTIRGATPADKSFYSRFIEEWF